MENLLLPDGFDWTAPNYDAVIERRVGMLRRMREEPGMVPALREHFKTRPGEFIAAFGVTYDPRNPEIGLPATIPFVLFPRQREYIDWLYDGWKSREDGLVEKSREMGVSWLSMAFSVWMWLFHPGVVIGVGSRKEEYVDDLSDPKSLFWKARLFVNMLPEEFRPAGWNPKAHAPFMALRNPENGSVIVGEAGDNIGRGARTSIYFCDEAAFIERPELVDAALSQTTNCRVDVSTPNGVGNPFYKKRHGGKVPVFIFDWRDDPRKGEEWYEKQKAKLDPVVLAQEVDRRYEGSVSNAFIPGELVQAAMDRPKNAVVASGGLRFGLDVARFGDDSTVLTVRRGRLLIKQVRWSKTDLMSTAGRARQEILAYGEEPEQIAVDVVGMGAGVADALRAWFPDQSVPGTREVRKIVIDVASGDRLSDGTHYNVRAFMAAEVKEWLKTASIPKDETLRVELTSLRYGFRGGELLMESKDDAKRRGIKSPDGFDSLALTFAVPTIPRRKRPKTEGYVPAVSGVM